MKTSLLFLSCAATLAMASCSQEKTVDTTTTDGAGTVTTTTTTTQKLTFQCFECSGNSMQPCNSVVMNCPMCMVFHNDQDNSTQSSMHCEIRNECLSLLVAKFDRRCCWWGCGTPGQVSVLERRNTYFCNTDKCNGPGSEAVLGYYSKCLGDNPEIPHLGISL